MLDDVINKIELLCILGDKKHCFQTVKTLRIATTTKTLESTNLVVMATSTDGYLSIWDITDMLSQYKERRLRLLRDRKNNDDSEQGFIKREMEFSALTQHHHQQQHVNRNRHKFHELEVPLFPSSTLSSVDGHQMLCFHHKIHQSGINSLDVVVLHPKTLLDSDSGINCLIFTYILRLQLVQRDYFSLFFHFNFLREL